MIKKLIRITQLIIIRLKKLFGVKSFSYSIGKYLIKIPLKHSLSLFQKNYKLYNRFLPILSKCLTSDETIIDIGANVGDTAISMMNETTAKIICIEPSDIYFSYLEKNIRNLPALQQEQLSCIKAFVGTNVFSGKLKHSGGTAVVEESINGNVKYKSLDDLLKTSSTISLIKVDIDGFDYDALLSAKESIRKLKPILFWENQIDNKTQFEGYEKLYNFLEKNDYKYLYIFDNFGNLMFENADYNALRNINSYVYSMKSFRCTRTIFYTDILAVSDKDNPRVNQVISEYKKEWINKVNFR